MDEKYDVVLLSDTANRLKTTQDRAAKWLMENTNNGKPTDADSDVGWSRVIWALALSGQLESAGQVMQWAESHRQFDKEGNFSLIGPSVKIGTYYWLAHYPIGAMMLGRYDLVERTMQKLADVQDEYGGYEFVTIEGKKYADLLSTAQVGYTAVICGNEKIAHSAYKWVMRLLDMQERLNEGVMYTFCIGDKLVTDIPDGLEFLAKVDMKKPRQAYFNPGIAAVFLIAYGQKFNKPEVIETAERLLELNRNGTDEQFKDNGSVQICKYGWGVAALIMSDAERYRCWQKELCKMAKWFSDMQQEDGSWVPSRFLVENPSTVQRMSKTAEHLMEINYMMIALGCLKSQ